MRLCPNCNEWFDDREDICPHCGYRYVEDNNQSQIIDNDDINSTAEQIVDDIARAAKETVKDAIKTTIKKHNPWIITLTVLANLAVLLSVIDLFVSDYCWSCYPVILMALGFSAAKIAVAIKSKKSLSSVIGRYLLIMTGIVLFYSVIVTVASKAGQDLSYLTFYVLPFVYIAYLSTYLVLYFVKKISKYTLLRISGTLSGVCLLITFAGGVILKAQGFALAMSILPFALSLLVFVNMGLYIFINFKKQLYGEENEGKNGKEGVRIDYEIIDEDLTGEGEDKDKNDGKDKNGK